MRASSRLRALASLGVAAVLVTALHSASVSVPGTPASASDGNGPLFLTLSDGVQTVEAGGTLTYTVTLRSDALTAEFYDVTFRLPIFTNLIEASDGGGRVGDTIVWNNVSVSPTVTRRLYVSIAVSPYAEDGATMTAEVTAGGERAADVTQIVTGAAVPLRQSLKIGVSDGKEFVTPEEEVRYVISVANVSPEDRVFSLRADLPEALSFLGATGQYTQSNNVIIWNDQAIRADDERQFEVMAVVEREAPDFANIVFKASVDGRAASDLTVVHREAILRDFEVSVTDGQKTATPASELTYEIHIRNNEDVLATNVDVSDALPLYAEFVEASNGGVWTGNNVRWSNLTVSPHGERVLTLIAHVRTDAPIGADLRNSVESKGQVGVDITTVVAGSATKTVRAAALLRKTADRSEVRPGDTVTYTVSLTNSTDHAFRNVRIEDRLDNRYMTVIGAERGQMEGERLVWLIPELNPGQSWSVKYSVEISRNAPSGSFLDNVVNASGEGLETVSLSERVFTGKLGVVRKLPPTGAAFDQLFLLASGLLGLGQTLLLKRKIA
ncbi:MAG: hypothetical protein PHE68_00895 [Candidatus Peribacteraceae bacterium]|nr:hypothetical protein [Candidatus Peribacteraceae bacterium]MDD5074920.1 hypothetical protein [Candidatus Peribacteraceae bacterium]